MARNARNKRKWRIVKWIVVLAVIALLGNIMWNGVKRYRHKKAAEQRELLRQNPPGAVPAAGQAAPAAGKKLLLRLPAENPPTR